jgi:hypothetical protein
MNYNLWYDETVESIYIKLFGMLTEGDVHEMMAKIEELYEGKPRRYALIDLTEAQGGFLDKSARRAFREYAPKMQQGKMAVVGAKPVTQILAKAAIAALGSLNMTRFFKTEAEALAWLKGEK